jgi:hypothetical protein
MLRFGLLLVAIAVLAAAGSRIEPTSAASPARTAVDCRFEKGVGVRVEPRQRRMVVYDAGTTVDEFGNVVQSQQSERIVGILTPRGFTLWAGCRRVAPARLRGSDLAGPWPARVFSRVLCGIYGRAVRIDALRLRGGGYRLEIAQGRPALRRVVTATLRRNAGGISLQLPLCVRLSQ